jgi:acyl-CoA synthetase (AMP-forming)/AMP-acid ligase II
MIFHSPWPNIELPAASLCDVIFSCANQYSEKPALIDGETGHTLTYRQLVHNVRRVAAGLAGAGLRPGQPVALALPNSIEFSLAWYGTLLAGGWAVPINPLYTPAEMEFQIHDSGARFLITIPERATAMENAVEKLFVTGGNWKDLAECDWPAPNIPVAPSELAVLLYSSGTSGKPKGVMLTHSNIVANMRQLWATGWPLAEDLGVAYMPLYHTAGLNFGLNAFLGVGATVVLMPRFDLEKYLALTERYRATICGGPPPVILAITKSPAWDKFDLSAIRSAGCGAAPLGAELQEAFERRTGVLLCQVWGMTEATVLATTPPDPTKRKLGGCGYLLPSCEAQVVDVVTQKPLGVGETGEFWVRGPNVMKGYWKQPAATADTLVVDGWMRTGDVGYVDSDGCIFLVDRLKEMIKFNTFQVAPAELEDMIQSHPAVADAAVIGAPEPEVAEIPMAFVVKKQGAVLEAEELMQYVAARVAPYKKVRAVEFVQEIPKSPTGKILRRVLKEAVRTRAAAGQGV